ncbi:MAG: transporter substrate-binding domain-containing protein [Rhodospirillales bacterium]|nr:transporter substrate-binding domain-containing protein [Rhodospirillales bacterium]
MLERYAAIATLLLSVLAFLPTNASGEPLRIATNGDYPPFNYLDEKGQLAGFDVDIAHALCAAMDAACALVRVNWEDSIPALLSNRVDAVVASMSITEDRKRLVAFTNRYYRTPMQFVARKGFDRPLTVEGLKGVRVAVSPATTAHAYVTERWRGIVDMVLIPGQDNVNAALLEGKADLILADHLVMWSFVKGRQDVALIGEPILVDEGIGIALRPTDIELLRRFNQALVRIRSDGTYDRINARYFPFSIY